MVTQIPYRQHLAEEPASGMEATVSLLPRAGAGTAWARRGACPGVPAASRLYVAESLERLGVLLDGESHYFVPSLC
jgi:hypothetical protein